MEPPTSQLYSFIDNKHVENLLVFAVLLPSPLVEAKQLRPTSMISPWSCELSRNGVFVEVYTPSLCKFHCEHSDTSTVAVGGPEESTITVPKDSLYDSQRRKWQSSTAPHLALGPLGPLGCRLSYIEHQRLPWHPEGLLNGCVQKWMTLRNGNGRNHDEKWMTNYEE